MSRKKKFLAPRGAENMYRRSLLKTVDRKKKQRKIIPQIPKINMPPMDGVNESLKSIGEKLGGATEALRKALKNEGA